MDTSYWITCELAVAEEEQVCCFGTYWLLRKFTVERKALEFSEWLFQLSSSHNLRLAIIYPHRCRCYPDPNKYFFSEFSQYLESVVMCEEQVISIFMWMYLKTLTPLNFLISWNPSVFSSTWRAQPTFTGTRWTWSLPGSLTRLVDPRPVLIGTCLTTGIRAMLTAWQTATSQHQNCIISKVEIG